MKILLVSLFLPQERSSHAGGRYVFELLRQLSTRHEVHLATRCCADEAELLENLRPLCRSIHPYFYPALEGTGIVRTLRLGMNYLGFSRFADSLVRGGGYDLVQVEWVETAVLMGRHGTPLVLDAHDVITKPAERTMEQASAVAKPLRWLIWRLVRAVELRQARKCDAVMTVSEYDRTYLLAMDPSLRVRTVPIPAGMDMTERQLERRENTILFLASYRHRPVNVTAALWFYQQVLPLVRQRLPGARFIAAGYGPPEELRRLAETDPLTEVPGFVEDLERCHKEAAVFVAPILTGGGIIVKVLDALSAGTPVVTTSYGNEGVGATPGEHLLVAEEPRAFADAVVRLLTETETARRLGEAGQAFVRARYGREQLLVRLEAVYGEAVRPGTRDRG